MATFVNTFMYQYTSSTTCHRCLRNCIGCECPSVSPSGWQFLLTAVSTTWHRVTSPPSSNRRATSVTGSVYARRRRPSSMFLAPNTWSCVQFNCSSCVKQFANGSVVFWVAGHFLTPPKNWTVRAFLQLTPHLLSDFTVAWLTFTFPQLFAVAATLKSIINIETIALNCLVFEKIALLDFSVRQTDRQTKRWTILLPV